MPVTRPELIARLESIAGLVAGWTGLVPPAVATGRVAEELRAIARALESHDVEPDPAGLPARVGTANPGIVGSEMAPQSCPW